MRLKLYRGSEMAEAVRRARLDLGPDAMILAKRSVPDGVEVTAALSPGLSSGVTEFPEPPPLADPARVAALAYHGVPPTLADRLHDGALDEALRQVLLFGELPSPRGGPPLLLVGPPGAGKTLTTARLATRLVLSGAIPMVITADGRRAGATEQLAAFTRVLGLNVLVASHPVTLGRALSHRQDSAPVVIDGPGGDPFDPAHRDELTALAATAGAVIALVLPAGMDPAESQDIGQAFAEAGATMLIATRLDMARRLGGVLAATAGNRLALTEAGIGPGAADGLVKLSPQFLAERLLRTRAPAPQPAEHEESLS
ncbi:MAG: GTP-binding protein [Acidisphaera sp.]|nr:GTP-binding protein [Acidisphaera sp.]